MESRTARAVDEGDDLLIVELFVHQRPLYDEADVLRLARIAPARLELAIDQGEVEPLSHAGARRFTWAEVVELAILRWTPRMIAGALRRAGAEHALPYLNQTRTIRIELPLYQIRLLHWLAVSGSEAGKPPLNVSDVLERELDALAADDRAEREVRGFRAAREFPSSARRPHALEQSCIYCGSQALVRGCDACAACIDRHEQHRGATEKGGDGE